MRWSIEELILALKLYKSYTFFSWLKNFPRKIYKRTIIFFKWLFTGYTNMSLYDLRSFLIDVIIFRINKFIKYIDNSYPCEFNSHEEWVEALQELKEYFIKMRDGTYLSETDNIVFKDDVVIFEQGRYVFRLTEEDTKLLEIARINQNNNNKKALEIFVKYFDDLWD